MSATWQLKISMTQIKNLKISLFSNKKKSIRINPFYERGSSAASPAAIAALR